MSILKRGAIPIKDTGIFKNLTGQNTIDAENKFEQQSQATLFGQSSAHAEI